MAKPKNQFKPTFGEKVSDSLEDIKKAVKIDKPKKKVEAKEKKEDRSAYNCKECGGDGLVALGTKDIICDKCHGTGKI